MTKRHIEKNISQHARQRMLERYGEKFSKRKWDAFWQAIQKEKNVISLSSASSGCRRACCFQGKWYFFCCNSTGVILTFLPLDALTEEDKSILNNNARYLQSSKRLFVRNSHFVLSDLHVSSKQNISLSAIDEKELPADFDKAEQYLQAESKRIY
ncbi:MAG: hypothetical protein LBJ67_14050 [Planctomycetaceae bacterium]|jgi:hypothetical protein|nr:hypothetical protein [Planctomycetaceae bacterium]